MNFNINKYIPFKKTWDEKLMEGLHERLGDADALLLIPYDDGTFWLKQGYYDKDLVGGIGGYETPDEDKFVVDGSGDAVKSLLGVPIALAIDPSEHAGIAEPIKALIGQKEKVGEWIRVDRDDNVIEVGPALEAPPERETSQEQPQSRQLASDGGQVVKGTDEYERLLSAAESGQLDKLYDLSPPSRIVVDEDGNETVETATGYLVSQSKAADLLPKKWSSEKLQVMQDKARMEEHEEGKLMKYAGYGVLVGYILALLSLGVFWFLGQIGGGVF